MILLPNIAISSLHEVKADIAKKIIKIEMFSLFFMNESSYKT